MSVSNVTVNEPKATRLRPGPKHVEAKPWDDENSPGEPNPGSYSYAAAAGMASLAATVLRTIDPDNVPDRPRILYLARILLRTADIVQAVIRADGHVDRSATSHTRARGAVHTAIEILPPPLGADDATRNQWEIALTDLAIDLLDVAAQLNNAGPDITGSPWIASVTAPDSLPADDANAPAF